MLLSYVLLGVWAQAQQDRLLGDTTTHFYKGDVVLERSQQIIITSNMQQAAVHCIGGNCTPPQPSDQVSLTCVAAAVLQYV